MTLLHTKTWNEILSQSFRSNVQILILFVGNFKQIIVIFTIASTFLEFFMQNMQFFFIILILSFFW